ncbi:hypothetical protein Lesp02_63060 [Lentzea sp. NBRC 105346]|uniref:NACHT and WD repeat domain-containing protein n=1 Tax=Lentzea sp. NBRC 105346 TaxID=3032205 RepID=UPI0024A1CC1F|nr:NACHT and WD repeat domain-containing protein [Lentzea sp. NBRC 105346]GLZ34119.1 hypothetical protein Lesp02_63060 [Lentzea sp. NBRC 105346]
MTRRERRPLDLLPLLLGVVLGLGTNLITGSTDNWPRALQPVARYAWLWLPALILLVLIFELLRRWFAGRHRTWSHGSPYPGLEPYTAEHAAVFFGRDAETRALLDRLARSGDRFIPIVGPSGTGKSSLIQAGVLAGLGSRWTVYGPVEPGADPFAAVASVLTTTDRARCARLLRDEASRGGPPSHLLSLLPAGRCLLVVDQWEDLTRVPDAGLFTGLIEAALGAHRSLHVLVALRPDALGEFSTSPLFAVPFAVGPLEPRLLRQVIVGPARAAGVSFDDGLVEQMVAEATVGDALPLLGHLLQRLYTESSGDRLITIEEYDRAGRVGGAIARHADEVLHALVAVHASADIETTLLKFVSWEGREPTRRVVPAVELDATGRRVVEEFRAARLLVDTRDGTAFDLAHDALLRQWDWLRDLIQLNEERLRHLDRLRAQAVAWERSGRADDLLRGQALADAEALVAADGALANFVSASHAQQQLSAGHRADNAAAWARQHFERDNELAKTIAVAAVREQATPAATTTLWGLQAEPTWQRFAVGHTDKIVGMGWLPGEARLVTVGADGLECVWNSAGELVATTELPVSDVDKAEVSPDGTRVVLHDSVTTVAWSRHERRVLAERRDSASTRKLRWSRDGTRLISWAWRDPVKVWGAGLEPDGEIVDGGLVHSIDWAPDGNHVALATGSALVVVETSSWTTRQVVEQNPSLAVAWSPDGTRIAALVCRVPEQSDVATALVVYDLAGGGEIAADVVGAERISWSPDGGKIAVSQGFYGDVCLLFDAATGTSSARVEGQVELFCWSPSTPHLAIADPADGRITLWDTVTGAVVRTTGGEVSAPAWGPGRSLIAITQENSDARLVGTTLADNAVLIGSPDPEGVAWSAGGLIAVAHRGEVVVWSAATREVVQRLPLKDEVCPNLGWSVDGQHLVVCGESTTVWAVRGTEFALVFSMPRPGTRHLAWSVHGSLAVADDRMVDVRSLPDLAVAVAKPIDEATALAWSPDGSQLAVGAGWGSIHLWDVAADVRLLVRRQTSRIRRLAWSPDGRRLATFDGGIRIWDTGSGDELGVTKAPWGVAWLGWDTPDEIQAMTPDGKLWTWTLCLDAETLLGQGEARELTVEERIRFGLSGSA